MARTSKQSEVLDAAEALFEADGFVATGVNQITKEANVASMTLYNNFANKDDLILAVVQRRADQFVKRINQLIDSAGDDPKKAVLTVFDAMDTWISSQTSEEDGFVGCFFLKASIEFTTPSHPAHIAAASYKMHLVDVFEQAAIRLGAETPRELALKLHILLDGAITQAQIFNDRESAKRARDMAEQLLSKSL